MKHHQRKQTATVQVADTVYSLMLVIQLLMGVCLHTLSLIVGKVYLSITVLPRPRSCVVHT
jgi:hypothetical protein